MGKRIDLTKEKIVLVIGLHAKSVEEITSFVGMNERTIQAWMKQFRDYGRLATPQHRDLPGKVRKTFLWTLNIIKKQYDVHPHLKAQEIKEQNPMISSDVRVSIVYQCIHDNLNFCSHYERKKPLFNLTYMQHRIVFAKTHIQQDMAK